MKIYHEILPEFEAHQFNGVGFNDEVEIADWVVSRGRPRPRITFPIATHMELETLTEAPKGVLEVFLPDQDPMTRSLVRYVHPGEWLVFDVLNQKWVILCNEEFSQNFELKA